MFYSFILGPRKLAWSIKHPPGVTYTRDTFAEAVQTAAELSSRMKNHGVEHYRCRVFKTYGKAA